MKPSTLPSTLMASLALAIAPLAVDLLVPSASAQPFVGSDNFDAGLTSAWTFSYRLNDATQGAITFTNSRLDVTQAAGGAGNLFWLWDGNPADPTLSGVGSRSIDSFTTSWIMDVSVTNQLSGLTGGEFLAVGLQARNNFDYFATFLLAGSGGISVTNEHTGGFTTQVSTAAISTEDVILRLSWDATAQKLATSYSFDSGSTFTNLRTDYDVSGWTGNAPTTGFNFEVFMNSSLPSALTAGTAYMDNFSISAIPEPSAFAMFAGLAALGLAGTRRRRRA